MNLLLVPEAVVRNARRQHADAEVSARMQPAGRPWSERWYSNNTGRIRAQAGLSCRSVRPTNVVRREIPGPREMGRVADKLMEESENPDAA